MPDALELELDITELDNKLLALPKSLANKGARKATRAAAKVVLADAKALVPEDTGQLKRSLKVRSRKRSRRNKGTVGHSVVTGESLFTGDQYYGGFIELGTRKKEADPYLRPALWGNQPEILRQYVAVLKSWLRQDAPKAAAKANFDLGELLDDLQGDI